MIIYKGTAGVNIQRDHISTSHTADGPRYPVSTRIFPPHSFSIRKFEYLDSIPEARWV